MHDRIALLVNDPAVLSSLQFVLSVEGYKIRGAGDHLAAAALVIDQSYQGDGLAKLIKLRAAGCVAPAIILVTNPTMPFRARVATAGAALIEKPLIGDDLSRAIDDALHPRKAA